MTHPAVEAAKNLKTIGNEITQWENRLEYVKMEVQKNTQVRDSLLAQIAKKTEDYDIYMAQKDAEVKKERALMLSEKEQLAKDKEEFQGILKQHKTDKSEFEFAKRDLEIQKLKHAATTQNVQEFITAVKRAVGLLGI